MINFHYMNLNGEGAILLGHRKVNPVMECMVVRLSKLRERDEQELVQIVSEPAVQNEVFLYRALHQRVHPRAPWYQNWMSFLWRYVEMVELPALKGIMDHEQYRIYEMLWKALVTKSKRVTLSPENTLYEPVDV